MHGKELLGRSESAAHVAFPGYAASQEINCIVLCFTSLKALFSCDISQLLLGNLCSLIEDHA